MFWLQWYEQQETIVHLSFVCTYPLHVVNPLCLPLPSSTLITFPLSVVLCTCRVEENTVIR